MSDLTVTPTTKRAARGCSAVDYLAAGERLARESRLAQGLPPTISDPLVLARLATLVSAVGRSTRGAEHHDRRAVRR